MLPPCTRSCPSTCISYAAPVVVLVDAEDIESTLKEFREEIGDRYSRTREEGGLYPAPDEAYVGEGESAEWLARSRRVSLNKLEWEGAIRFGTSSPGDYRRNLSGLVSDAQKELKRGNGVYFFCANKFQRQRAEELLEDIALEIDFPLGGLSSGFRWPEIGVFFLSEEEVFGRYHRPYHTPPARSRSLTYDPSHFQPGDFIVHVNHGIGRYMGMRVLDIDSGKTECLDIRYGGEDHLFIPIAQLRLLEKYVAAEDAAPQLDKLGSASWTRTREKARRSAEKIARDLLEIYAARQIAKGFAFPPDKPWQAEMEASFPYEETERSAPRHRRGQGRHGGAASDGQAGLRRRRIRQDGGRDARGLQSGHGGQAGRDPRSDDGARDATFQHGERAPRRVSGDRRDAEPVRLERETEGDRGGGGGGKGGHRHRHAPALEGHPVQGPRARRHRRGAPLRGAPQGFVQADEDGGRRPQHDGDADPPHPLDGDLRHPRFFRHRHPPRNRLPIHTEILSFDDASIRDAVMREIDRGGQVFFVHNRVQSIAVMEGFLRRLLPDRVRISHAHGQMPERELERRMIDFLERKFDVLVCTTIIESGLDIPNVNTIVINRAGTLGLAQLYQLRGRVGRSAEKAYAYLLVPRGRTLTPAAMKRLQAISEFDYLGAGYRIAMRDLEIRGAGNLLGVEQSGNIAAVGLDLYTRMLKEEVARLKGEHLEPESEVRISAPLPAYLPSEYVPDSEERMDIYRRLSRIETAAQAGEMAGELRDRFGPPRQRRQYAENRGAQGPRCAPGHRSGRNRPPVLRSRPASERQASPARSR